MSDVLNHDGIEVNHEEQFRTKRLVWPDGYEYREVDIEEIKTALEQFADNLVDAG